MQPYWIDTPNKLANLTQKLESEPLIAVDTESDSLYSYFEKVCLIQFSIPSGDYLVDPLNIDISCFSSLFANPAIEKIFHAAEYDFLSLKRDYDFTFNNLFDTMLAARILGWTRYGLGVLLAEHFGVKLNKRFQRYNWGKRPLSNEALNYARLDTHYLIQLRDIQLKELKNKKRLREAMEAFERLTQVEPNPKVFNPDDFWRIKGTRDLYSQQQAVLLQLYILRDQIARKINRPLFKVMSDNTLIEIAKIQPQNYADLKVIKGIGEKILQYNGDDILKTIKKGLASPPPHPPHNHHRPSNSTLARYESLRHWRNTIASKRGVEPDVIINNHALMDIAWHNPQTLNSLTQTGILGDWQFETYGKALLKILQSKH